MPASRSAKVAARKGDYGPFPIPTAPVAGTSEVQTLTIGGTPTSGFIDFTFKGRKATAAWSATNATLIANVDAALESLPSIGTGNIATAAGSLTAGIGTITLTFGGALARKAVPTIVATNRLVGTSPTAAITETTPGVDATLRGAPKGAIAVAVDTGKMYSNTGTADSPTWVLSATLNT